MTVITNNCFPVKYYENLVLLILQIIEYDTWTLQEIWGDVFGEVAKRDPQRCLSEAFNLSLFSQKDSIKCIGGYVLACIVEGQNGENSEDILKKIYLMAQDPSSTVRKNMCKALRVLIRVLNKKIIETQLIPEVLKLVEDDSAEVLDTSIPLFCDLIEHCGFQCKEETMEVIKDNFFTSQLNKLAQVKLKYFGKLMVSLRLAMDEEFRSIGLRWFIGFEESKENDIKALMAYNFPAVVYILGSMDDSIFAVFKTLAYHDSWSTKKVIGKQLGDICRISNYKESELIQIVKAYCEDENTLSLLIGQLFTISKFLKNTEYFLEILLNLLNQSNNWRKTIEILKEFINFIENLDCSHILDKLLNTVLISLKTHPCPVKPYSAKLLAHIFYKSLARKEELSSMIIFELGRSQSCYVRVGYIYFCKYLSSISSHELFSKYFIPELLKLSKDPALNVVYTFANNFADFRLSLPFNSMELVSEFKKIFNYYIETNDKILHQMCLLSDEKINKMHSDCYNQIAEAKENLKIKTENEISFKENFLTKPEPQKKTKKKLTVVPRGSSYNPNKRLSLGEADRKEINKVIQKVSMKKKK
jgi:hypothetical protein